MKKFLKRISEKVAALAARARLASGGIRGEGYVDSGVKILIAVVIGALLLAGLYALFNDTVLPTVVRKVKELFNYGH